MSARAVNASPPPLRRGAARLSAWAQITPPIATLRDAALLSRQMWCTCTALLPAALQTGVQPGRWHDGVWSLTASSSAVAAKLSQFKPLLLQHLQQHGFALRDIRIRVQPRAVVTAPPPAGTAPATACPQAVAARLRALLARQR
jgi:hypothetical protein